MAFFEFLGYCFSCMINCFVAIFGHVPDGFTIKDGLVGIATFVVIVLLIILILWLTGIIKFKKKGE